MGDTTTALHPFDFERLQKGTWIETIELEAAATCKVTDPSFQLRVLSLRDAIERRTGILSRIEGQRLRLMTDGEALVWTIAQAGDASRKLDRNAERVRSNINHAALTATEQTVHEHATRVLSAMAQAQRQERAKAAQLFALTPRVLPEDAA
jgi:hypothetical protein